MSDMDVINSFDAHQKPSRSDLPGRRLRLLTLRFDIQLRDPEVARFRGAFGRLAGSAYPLIHNHQSDGYRRAYPLVQYFLHSQCAAILAIDEGADELLNVLAQSAGASVRVGNRPTAPLEVLNQNVRTFRVATWPRMFAYRLRRWTPLRPEDRPAYEKAKAEGSLADLFARKLNSHILSFAKGVGWQVTDRLETTITDIEGPYTVPFKNMKLLAFNVRFRMNASLPDDIGLGKHASTGFGRIRRA